VWELKRLESWGVKGGKNRQPSEISGDRGENLPFFISIAFSSRSGKEIAGMKIEERGVISSKRVLLFEEKKRIV